MRAWWAAVLTVMLLAPAWGQETILGYRKQLGLSETSARQIAIILANFQRQGTAMSQALNQQESEYQVLVASHADLAPLKAKLLQIAQTRFQLRVLDLVAARKISETLTPAQMTRWVALQKKARSPKK